MNNDEPNEEYPNNKNKTKKKKKKNIGHVPNEAYFFSANPISDGSNVE